MSICGDFGRVFEVGPVFRAEDSFTHRHLCEFTGLDVEMEIKKHYSEVGFIFWGYSMHQYLLRSSVPHIDIIKCFMQVMDIVDQLFVEIFDKLNEKCKKELEAVAKQYSFEPLKVSDINFSETPTIEACGLPLLTDRFMCQSVKIAVFTEYFKTYI